MRLTLPSNKVACCFPEKDRVMVKVPYAAIARTAEQAANLLSVMVYGKVLDVVSVLLEKDVATAADGADSLLLKKQAVVVGLREPVPSEAHVGTPAGLTKPTRLGHFGVRQSLLTVMAD